MKALKTSDIARAGGVHPNTVRLYESWGLLPTVPRSPAGYRLFSPIHVDQIRLVRLAFKCTLLGRDIKRLTYSIIYDSAACRYVDALEKARQLALLIGREYRQAEAAAEFLERWARGERLAIEETGLNISQTAKLLDVTVDMLRDWERNNLITIPRNPGNGYRIYGADELNLLRIIRMLRRSRYSNMAILRVINHIRSGSSDNIREIINTPILDEDRGYLCFTDNLLTVLDGAARAATEIVTLLESKVL